MKAYFLHWDEELINPNRIWLPRLAQYDASYLAFLLQFYSLFFDEIYVPANFMTDNNEILKILHALDIENPNSAICSTAHPLKIIWDTVRFPSEGFAFKELLWTSHKKKSDVSYRNPHHIEEAMELCDLILSNKVVPLAVEPKYEREDSVKYLKKNVFNENQNKSEEVQDRGKELLQCLKDIERLGSDIPGYGRNIYYKIFGLSRPDPIPSHLALAKRFRSVTEKLTTDEKIAFIRSVDYVSNILKAVVTKKAMGSPEEEEWAILIPNELLRFVRYPSQDQAVGDANCVVKASELATRRLSENRSCEILTTLCCGNPRGTTLYIV
ncbi:MAG: hypothetical protein KAV83_01890 [Desulfobacterales bacterium]|nr:hypothetical protein [Desulfobacterales bacterium]